MSHFSWESGFDIPRVLGHIADCRHVGKDGRVSFDAHQYNFWLPVLESAVRVSKSVAGLKHHCITRSVNDGSLSLKDEGQFLERCEKAYSDLSARPKTRYVVLMSMTYSGQALFGRMIDGDVAIEWQPTSRTKFMRAARKAREGLARIRKSHGVPEEPENITHLAVHTSAYDPYDAHTVATDTVDSLRGLLNLLVNWNLSVNPFSRLSRPHAVNRFRSGPYRTVHNIDGSLATETLWYEHRWLHEVPVIKFKTGDVEKFTRNIRVWWRRLQKNSLREHVREGLLRYCRALDLHDAEPTLLDLWGALESLTGTQREKYDVTVGRTVQLFFDRDDARQIAQHVRFRRNSTIHAARTLNREEADATIVHAEFLVSRILFFCLEHGNRFADISELFQFFDLRLDDATLKRKIAISKFFVEYQQRH